MICFEIFVNEKLICTAGIESKFGVLASNLAWVRRDLDQFKANVRNDVPEEELNFDVSGQSSVTEHDYEMLDWVRQSLSPGDEIKIRIMESTHADEPSGRRRDDPDLVEKAQRRYYEKLKEKYENHI